MAIQLIDRTNKHSLTHVLRMALMQKRVTKTLATTRAQQKKCGHRGLPLFIGQMLALTMLVLLSPLLLTVALLIRLESRGSVFYSQLRVGENGRRFTMYKLRSMYLPTDPRFKAPDPAKSNRQGLCQKFKKDPRITCIGWFIRKYSIDELPQLFNVLNGDMCLVGPRPALTSEVEQYSHQQQARLHAKPGLTGLWQVSGRADINFEQQVELDIHYIASQSPWLDLKLLFLTVPAVLMAKGADRKSVV